MNLRLKYFSSLLLAAIVVTAVLPPTAFAATALPFVVTASEIVNVDTTGGTPRLALDIGGVTRYATYASGTGTTALTFTYTAQPGDFDLDGITVASPLDLNGGTIRDAGGNSLSSVALTLPATAGVKVDHPSLSMNFLTDKYTLAGASYNSLASFLSASGGSFTRATTATYYDASGNLQTAAANVPRFDYDPVTLAARGMRFEEARTNYVTNSSFTGISSGGPYTTPQNYIGWTLDPGGLGSATVTKGSSNGIDYLDIRFQVTNATAGTRYPGFNTPINIAAVANGEQTSLSGYIGVTSYSSSGGTCEVTLSNRSYTSAPAYLAETKVIFTATSPYQFRQTASLTHGATAATASASIYIATPPGATCDTTFRLGGPQLEKGGFPTSFIPTSNAAVTRAVDIMTIPAGAWFSGSQGTLMTQSVLPFLGGPNYPGSASLETNGANAIHLFITDVSGDYKASEIHSGGTNYFASGGSAYIAGNTLKHAIAYETNNSIMAADGVLGILDTSVTLPPVTMLRVGTRRSNGNPLNGFMRQLKYYPARLTGPQLQLLTQ